MGTRRVGTTPKETTMERKKHRILVLAIVLAVLGTLLAPGSGRVGAQDATPAATLAAIPATPVGDQLAWVLVQLNGGATTLTEAELTAHFAPTFLANFLPAPVLLDLLR